MKITNNSTWLATGDSITDAGRHRPVGEGLGLGTGYVKIAAGLLGRTQSYSGIRVLNTGVGGNTVRDLAARWQQDVRGLEPDWLTVMIGTNDVWRQFDEYDRAAAILPDEFQETYRRLVADAAQVMHGVVLMAPFYVQPDRDDPMRRRMDEYGAIVRRIAEDSKCAFVDTQAALDAACETADDPLALAPDRVHPSARGATVIAHALLTDGFGLQFKDSSS